VANEAMLTGESVPQIKESLALVDRELLDNLKSGEFIHDMMGCSVVCILHFLFVSSIHGCTVIVSSLSPFYYSLNFIFFILLLYFSYISLLCRSSPRLLLTPPVFTSLCKILESSIVDYLLVI
jgi:hypothetical protein